VVDWGNYNSDHIYTKYYEPTTSLVQFLISDRYDNWFSTSWNNQAGMNDNSGNLTLNVYECKNPPVTIKAHKVICDSEQYLPNWGNHGKTINDATAQNLSIIPVGIANWQPIGNSNTAVSEVMELSKYKPTRKEHLGKHLMLTPMLL